MRAIGCVFMLVLLAMLAGETLLALKMAAWIHSAEDPEYLGVILSVIGLSIAGYYLIRWRIANMTQAVLGGTMGRNMVGTLGAFLLVFPGFATAALGILLQLPPLQALLGKTMGRLAQAYAQKAMASMAGKMGGVGGAGAGGRFGGGMGGAFPGMKPDQRVRKGKTIDTEGERLK